MYAYLYLELSKMGIENIGESQLVGYPTQFPSVSMVNWETGKPNARFRVLELLKRNFGPGDILVDTQLASPDVAGQAYRTAAGRKFLLVNKGNAAVTVNLPPNTVSARLDMVDAATGENPSRSSTLSGTRRDAGTFCRRGDFHTRPMIWHAHPNRLPELIEMPRPSPIQRHPERQADTAYPAPPEFSPLRGSSA